MSDPVTVIVGTSNSGVATAQALRRASYRGRIVLLGEETVWPYDKPPLSKGFLAGTAGVDDISLLSEAHADDLGIELRLGCLATGVDPTHTTVHLESGEKIGFDHLVIATGAHARPSPWGQPGDVHLLRSLADARRLDAALKSGGRLVIIGGGFIGSEIASTARSRGLEVTIVDPQSELMEHALGRPVGSRFTALHRRHGVSMLLGVAVGDVIREEGQLRIELSDGRSIETDLVVVGIGAIPNDEWLRSSGLQLDNGVVCDQYCRAVDSPSIFAVGDVARWHNPRYGRLCRVEHWTNATEQANVVAHNIAHPSELMPYAPIEYIWSDQYDWKLRIAGHTGGASEIEIIGAENVSGRFAALYSHGERNLAGIAVVNWPRALVAGRKALQLGKPYEHLKETLNQLIADEVAVGS